MSPTGQALLTGSQYTDKLQVFSVNPESDGGDGDSLILSSDPDSANQPAIVVILEE